MAMCPESKKYIAGNIICQWIEMMMNTIMIFIISKGIEKLYIGNLSTNEKVLYNRAYPCSKS